MDDRSPSITDLGLAVVPTLLYIAAALEGFKRDPDDVERLNDSSIIVPKEFEAVELGRDVDDEDDAKKSGPRLLSNRCSSASPRAKECLSTLRAAAAAIAADE